MGVVWDIGWSKPMFTMCVSYTRLCIEQLILEPCVWVLGDARDTTHICCGKAYHKAMGKSNKFYFNTWVNGI